MDPLVECVPNFSEGRRPEVVEQIVQAIAAVPEAVLLAHELDADHNRSVVTFVAPPDAAVEAAFAAIAVAARLIDMDQHRGEHPRLGAADVVPFVPIHGLTMADCVALARRLGERVGTELGIPVYLYEAAATRPERTNLADVRRGEYEALKSAISSDPARTPDFGPSVLPAAGATIIGARPPLIAYNVYLTTDDVEIARRIARVVRHSGGGLRAVKALGMLVEGRAQVSMNLTDYSMTPIHQAVELIRREAARYGVAVASSELVGLIPQAALFDAARWYLQLDNFHPDQVLEQRIRQVQGEGAPAFLDELAAPTPTPGGGAAAAHSGAMAAALVSMVAGLTAGKKQYAEAAPRMAEVGAEAAQLRTALETAAQEDAAAFEAVLAAYRLPKGTPEQQGARTQAIEQAMHGAARVPMQTARAALRVLALSAELTGSGLSSAVTDAAAAGALAHTALRVAGWNVKINATSVQDRAAAESWLAELAELEAEAARLSAVLSADLSERGGFAV